MKQRIDSEGDLSPSPFFLKAVIWSALILSDAVIGVAAAVQGFRLPGWAVFLVAFLALLGLELGLWRAVERLFR